MWSCKTQRKKCYAFILLSFSLILFGSHIGDPILCDILFVIRQKSTQIQQKNFVAFIFFSSDSVDGCCTKKTKFLLFPVHNGLMIYRINVIRNFYYGTLNCIEPRRTTCKHTKIYTNMLEWFSLSFFLSLSFLLCAVPRVSRIQTTIKRTEKKIKINFI